MRGWTTTSCVFMGSLMTVDLDSPTANTVAVSYTEPTAQDPVPGMTGPVKTFVPSLVDSKFTVGTTTANYTWTDVYGNVAVCTFNVT